MDVDKLKGTLTIKETQHVDAGDYTCVAVNAAGTSSGKISLDVGGESGTGFSYVDAFYLVKAHVFVYCVYFNLQL